MSNIVVYGKLGSSSLNTIDDLRDYRLQVEWAEKNRWRDTRITLPSGQQVAIDQYVGVNFQKPRNYHPEYALAIELLLANAVYEAKQRGFRIVAVEMGLYPYRTFTEMGKRITKIGLAEPIMLEDGRTKSYTGYQWVDHEGEGVTLLPWGSGDQVIRLKDNRGYYVEPINEATADMAQCRQTLTWRKVHQYPQLPYERNLEWCDVPLLDSSDPMTEKLDCERCHKLFPVEPWPFIVDGPLPVFDHRPKKPKKYIVPGTGKRFCLPCREAQNRSRVEAAAQGWNHDTGKQFSLSQEIPNWLKAKPCEHRWGTQVSGTPNVPGRPKTLRYRYECILCGEPAPDEHLTQQQRELAREQLDRDYYRSRS